MTRQEILDQLRTLIANKEHDNSSNLALGRSVSFPLSEGLRRLNLTRPELTGLLNELTGELATQHLAAGIGWSGTRDDGETVLTLQRTTA